MARVYLGLGSNLGDREWYLAQAVAHLEESVRVEEVSSLYETEPVGYREQPFFLNAVLQGVTELEPLPLLHLAKAIEEALGRQPTFPNGPRTIDIDLLLYGH